MSSFAATSAMRRSLVERAISRSLCMLLSPDLANPAHHGVRAVGRVRADLRRPVALFRSFMPGWAIHHVRGIQFIYGEVARHSLAVRCLDHVARTRPHTGHLQNLRDVFGIVD